MTIYRHTRLTSRHACFCRLSAVSLLLLLLAACAGPIRLSAVPEERTIDATIPGIPGARFWVDKESEPFLREALLSFEKEKAYLASIGYTGDLPPVSFLAVSGGGDNGAFGAGLMKGWTEHGGRPEFKGVTGVSTGALIAPLAFLGPEHDDTLAEAYTAITKADIFESRGFISGVFSDALADTLPMSKMIERYVTQDLLDAIAVEYAKGRLLFVGTTNLDARRPIIWNMTAIAASTSPNALPLFRKILMASAAVPGAFPPVMIDVEVDGEAFQEMHVDGGAMAQVFLYPATLNLAEQSARMNVQRQREVYIIRNARLDPDWADVERRTFSIAGRAISSLIHSQGIGDLYRIYLTSQRDGLDYNLAFIGPDFDFEHLDEFDQAFMRALYRYGYDLGRQGYPWRKAPPGFEGFELTPQAEGEAETVSGAPSS
ncbi:MAG: patatin-like phospholipase family protein [Kiloniellaceae bacterium]